MPEGKHLKGVGAKEQRQYEHIKEEAEKDERQRQTRMSAPPAADVVVVTISDLEARPAVVPNKTGGLDQ